MAVQVPDGKFMSTIKVGEKGQIVIPKGARDLFGIKPGDTLLLLADKDRGIAILHYDGYQDLERYFVPPESSDPGK
jgi:AbrB family looped-hinge helix DNA binding protein